MPPTYIVITPARDESLYIQKTIDSMANQTHKPAQWIIVNDGSTDETAKIINAATSKYPWIRIVHRDNRGSREAGSGVISAFYDGYHLLSSTDYKYIAKFDGDLSFEATYFEKCISEFEKDPKLGIGGGVCCIDLGGKIEVECPRDPPFHVRGPTKIYRKRCWEEIDGLTRAPGWDTIDLLKANMLGWKTRTFQEIRIIHNRPTGNAYGNSKDCIKNGLANYISGYHPVFMACKCLKRFIQNPFSMRPLFLMIGFAKGYAKKVPRISDKKLISYLRQQQWRAITFRESIWSPRQTHFSD